MLYIAGVLNPPAGDDTTRVAAVLAQTIETNGIDAAVGRYRTLRAQGFPGLRESEVDTNTLGYALLRKGEVASAIRVLQLNVETHPDSANVYDSLGEAYALAGNRDLAVVNYEKALAIDPKKKSARAALQALTGREPPPYRPLVLFHILNGLVGMVSGAAAMSLRKGSRWPNLAGRVFVVSMLSTAGTATYIAAVDPHGDVINVLMGALTIYLVTTSWLTARRKRAHTSLVDWVALGFVVAIGLGLVSVGVEAANSPDGAKDGLPAGLYFGFSTVAALAAGLDLRMILRGGVSGAHRLVRHLWRMCAALFIAVGSFFLGQPQVFPAAIRNSGILVVPTLLVLLALAYWLFRLLVLQRPSGPRRHAMGGPPPVMNPGRAR